eukprot:m.179163 g.179163  ORF g.179163 m.179163 type:complete len:427 (-) comp53416_c0_seq1:66-1346(-)
MRQPQPTYLPDRALNGRMFIAAAFQIFGSPASMDQSSSQTTQPAQTTASSVPSIAASAVLVSSSTQSIEGAPVVRGYDFNHPRTDLAHTPGAIHYPGIMASLLTSGYQATSLGQAVQQLNEMLRWRLSDEPVAEDEDEELRDLEERKKVRCKVFFGYTSCLISAGMRESIRYLVENSMVDVIVTTAGGIEEDFIKTMADTYVGDFALKGVELRKQGLNRIGNLLIPNDNYCAFENWIMPILDQMLIEQKTQGVLWTPSKLIARLGKEINNPQSVYYWAYKNNIPVYSPAITDGSLGDMIYFHSYKNPGLVLDIASDLREINSHAVFAKRTGQLILGGGLIKHHICNANLMRNGAQYSVYVNTAQEFDGSDAGAKPDEAVSWGKIRLDAKPVKVYSDATLVLPILVAESFVPEIERRKAAGVELRTK